MDREEVQRQARRHAEEVRFSLRIRPSRVGVLSLLTWVRVSGDIVQNMSQDNY